jgi:UDP-4-amino-4,6-dideoxy-N-acetyl-beta-L-altrosamine transaminase
MIPYSRQIVDEEDIDAVIDVLRSDYLTQGPVVQDFADAIASFTGSKYATALNSATSALHCVYSALGISRGDCVWTVANTFAATANAALYCGSTVDFVDIELRSFNIDLGSLEVKLQAAAASGTLPKLVVIVHFSGNPVDMEKVGELSSRFGFLIVEDASHALGSESPVERVGACRFSEATVFSLHPVKMITSGEGGVVTTNREDLKNKVQILSSHGITKNQSLFTNKIHRSDPWHYEQIALGFNYRLSEIHAALGLSQLKKLDGFIDARKKIADVYIEELNSSIAWPVVSQRARCSYHLFPIVLPHDVMKRHTRLSLFNELRANGIGAQVHYIPVYHHPVYKRIGFENYKLENTESYFARCISLPVYPTLSLQAVKSACSIVNRFCER